MPLPKPTYHSKLFREFKAIPAESQREIIRFYDENEQDILRLDFTEYFELLVAYIDALFIIGKYRQHLLMVDLVIEHVMQHNIYHFQQRDLFFEMLNCKGLSLLHTHEYAKAEDIFKQLIKIDPTREEVVGHLEKSIRVVGSSIQHRTRAVSIGFLFLAALVIGFEILLIRPFYTIYATIFEWIRTAFFLLACLITFFGEAIHWRRCKEKAVGFHLFVKEEKQKDLSS